eukprot:6018452-Alexandrium_andersonii.AAC.1
MLFWPCLMFPHGIHHHARGATELWPCSSAALLAPAVAMSARVLSQPHLGRAQVQVALVSRLWRARKRKWRRRWAVRFALPLAKKAG